MKIIVGIDPGTTTALAVVDVSSGFYATFSKRDFSFSSVCDCIASKGDAIILTSDKKCSESAKRLAAAFGARLWLPYSDMTVDEKNEMTKNKMLGNVHERDALAAALAAKRKFLPLFNKIDATLEKKGLSRISDEAKELLVKEEVGNIEQAIKLLLGEERGQEIKIIPRVIETKKVRKLREIIERQKRVIRRLEMHIQELIKENQEMRTVYKPNIRKKISKRYEKQISIGNDEPMIDEKYEAVVTPDAESIKDRIVLVEGRAGIKRFEYEAPRAIISDHELETDIPVVTKDRVRLLTMGKFLVVDKEELEKALKESFLEWLKNYRHRVVHE